MNPERKYYAVSKQKWDVEWHAHFRHEDGRESWDLVTKEEALEIADELEAKAKENPLYQRA